MIQLPAIIFSHTNVVIPMGQFKSHMPFIHYITAIMVDHLVPNAQGIEHGAMC